MKITILSLEKVMQMLKSRDHRIKTCNWISISDGCEESPLPRGENILKLNFDDATSQDHPEMALFNAEHAEQIMRFTKRLTGNELLIHCYSGISRSGAVGKLLNLYLNKICHNRQKDYAEFLENYDDEIFPNQLVKKILWNYIEQESNINKTLNESQNFKPAKNKPKEKTMIAQLPQIAVPDWINRTKEEIQNGKFPLDKILENSLYYPASGFDGDPVKYLAGNVLSFIYVDYGVEREEALNTLQDKHHNFPGYSPVAFRNVKMNELCPAGWTPKPPRPHDGNPEDCRIFIKQPFAIWGVFERNAGLDDSHGPERFSLLYICGDGVATFQALYHGNHCVPHAVAVINPGTGFGGNWTDFNDPTKIFARSVLWNSHGQPELLLYGGICPEDDPFYRKPCWPDYQEPVAYVPKYDGGYISIWKKVPRNDK